MRRRAVLTAVAGATTAVAGCGVLDSDSQRHPFAGATVTVRVDDESSSDHDLDANTRTALAFWETNGPEYAGFEVAFDTVTDEQPDMVVRYGDDPRGCGDLPEASGRVLGCAPKLGPNTTVPDPVVASVVATRLSGLVLLTTKHELGHVLGLGHSDAPRAVMSARPDDRFPLYQVRLDTHRAVLATRQRAIEGADRFERGIREWNNGVYAGAETSFEAANTAFIEARDRLKAARASFETAVSEREPNSDSTLTVDFAETLDTDGLRSLFDRALGRADTAAEFAARIAAGARAAADRDAETANARRDEASELAADFRDSGPVAVRDIAYALGLTREYSGDAVVVPVDPGAV